MTSATSTITATPDATPQTHTVGQTKYQAQGSLIPAGPATYMRTRARWMAMNLEPVASPKRTLLLSLLCQSLAFLKRDCKYGFYVQLLNVKILADNSGLRSPHLWAAYHLFYSLLPGFLSGHRVNTMQ